MGRRRGIGLPIALVIVLFLYFVATALVAQSRFNLRLATRSDQLAQDKYRCRALVAEAIADLNLGNIELDELENRGPGQARVWAEEDSESPAFYHLRVQVGEQSFSRVVRHTGGALPLLFSMNTNDGTIGVSKGENWEALPQAPTFVYQQNLVDGSIELVEGAHQDFDPTVDFQCAYADNQAGLFLVYQPADPDGLNGPPVILKATGPDSWGWELAAALPEKHGYTGLSADPSGSIFHLIRDDGSIERVEGTQSSTYPAIPASVTRLQTPFLSLLDGSTTLVSSGPEAYAETQEGDVYALSNGSWTEISVPDSVQIYVYDQATQTQTPKSAPFTDVHVGASRLDGTFSVYGIADFGPGDTYVMEWSMKDGTGDFGSSMRFGEQKIIVNEDGSTTTETVGARVNAFDIDGSGQPFVQATVGDSQYFDHPVSGRTLIGAGSQLLAAGGAPDNEGGEDGSGSEFAPLSHY